MASAETMSTQDFIRQGGSQTQVTYTKAEKDLLRNVKTRISTMGMTFEDVDILSRVRELGSLATVDRIISELLEGTFPKFPTGESLKGKRVFASF